MKEYDVIIIGCGPAGLSAAAYCGRAKLKTLIIGMKDNSRLSKAHSIENYIGFPEGIPGKELLDKGIEQVKRFGVELLNDEVTGAIKTSDKFVIKISSTEEFTSKSLIIATGISMKASGIEREAQFLGKGISYCVVCDGYFFQDKKISVIGNANYAAEEAIELLTYTKDITIFSQGKEFEINNELMSKIKENNIELRKDKVICFKGKLMLDKLILENGKEESTNGVFIAIGTASALNLATKLGIITNGSAIIIDKENKTNIKGIFAAGDCTGGNLQVAEGVGEGCNAGLSAIKFITGKTVYVDYSKTN